MPVRPKLRYSTRKSFCVLPVSLAEGFLSALRLTPCLLYQSGDGSMKTWTEVGLVKRADHPPRRDKRIDLLAVLIGDS